MLRRFPTKYLGWGPRPCPSMETTPHPQTIPSAQGDMASRFHARLQPLVEPCHGAAGCIQDVGSLAEAVGLSGVHDQLSFHA